MRREREMNKLLIVLTLIAILAIIVLVPHLLIWTINELELARTPIDHGWMNWLAACAIWMMFASSKTSSGKK